MNYNFKKLTPFKWFIIENFPFLEDSIDGLTNYQLFCKLGAEINKLIESQNLTGEQVEELTNAFNQLKDYVDNYFAELDIQEEIDNKLDEMAESGDLAEIISAYLNLGVIFYHDNVSEMLSNSNLGAGSVVQTLGFYTKNDGGSALYKIRAKESEEQPDEMFVLTMPNTELVAELIIEGESLDIRKIGATNNEDIHNYVLAIIDKELECIIPNGTWRTSPLQIAKYSSARITGMPLLGINNPNGTILKPIQDEQQYIMKIGYDNTTSIANDIRIKNIEFSTYITSGTNPVIYTVANALVLNRVQMSQFDELTFRYCKCTDGTMKITETWETRFGRIMFRQNDSDYALIFGTKEGSGNISSNYFEFLSFEGCRGNCMKFETNCAYSMNTIDTVDFESGIVAFDDETRASITSVESYIPLSIIEIYNGHGSLSINNLNINGIAQYVYTNTTTGDVRATDRIFEIKSTDAGYYEIGVNMISGTGNVNIPILINGTQIDKMIVNTNVFDSLPYFNASLEGCRYFEVLEGNKDFAYNYLFANVINPDQDQIRAFRHLKVEGKCKPYCSGDPVRAVRVATLVTKATKLYVHAKGTGNINFGGSDHVTLSNVEDYTWIPITITSEIGTSNNLLIGTNANVQVDDYFFAD